MTDIPRVPEHSNAAVLLARPLRLDEIPTPALLLDEARLDRAIRGMQVLADRAGVRLRPHVKTHKCPELAARQVVAGARGLCTAKTGEAEVFAAAGFDDLLVAYPVVGRRAEALARLVAERGGGLRAAAGVDSEAGADALAAAATRFGVRLGVWLEVDTGLRRSGLEPADPRLEALAARVGRAAGLRLHGVFTHAGHVYRARPDEVEAVARAESEGLLDAARRLDRAGFGPLETGLGSTPTVPVSAHAEGVVEIHPGVYVFGDRQQVRLRALRAEDVALSVLATVVSRPARDRWVLDAGSKTLSSDQGAHGVKGLDGFGRVRRPAAHRAVDERAPLPFAEGLVPPGEPFEPGRPALVARLSEEHGVVEGDAPLDAEPGDLVEIMPNHACPAANLAERLYVTRGGGEERTVAAVWAVAARAKVV